MNLTRGIPKRELKAIEEIRTEITGIRRIPKRELKDSCVVTVERGAALRIPKRELKVNEIFEIID